MISMKFLQNITKPKGTTDQKPFFNTKNALHVVLSTYGNLPINDLKRDRPKTIAYTKVQENPTTNVGWG